ncbi:MAG: hypothetical protein KKA84_08125 [Bacteroidetes bacterium]|nr:hypothetical protein [Bacteroidota bacterium]
MLKNIICLTLFALTCCNNSPSSPDENEIILPIDTTTDSIELPAGNTIALNGIFDSEEWAGAMEKDLTSSGKIRLMYHENYLYLGIKTKPNPVTTLFVYRDQEVHLYHSSAALGTAKYSYTSGAWTKIKHFSWHCQSTQMTSGAISERERFLADNWWVANNAFMGNSDEVEFKIYMPTDSLQIAFCTLGGTDYSELEYWPSTLADDCVNPIMLKGPIPDAANFILNQWILVKAP